MGRANNGLGWAGLCFAVLRWLVGGRSLRQDGRREALRGVELQRADRG